jgi:hypothetical protein
MVNRWKVKLLAESVTTLPPKRLTCEVCQRKKRKKHSNLIEEKKGKERNKRYDQV